MNLVFLTLLKSGNSCTLMTFFSSPRSKSHIWAGVRYMTVRVRMCVFVAIAGSALTERGRQVETSLLPSQSISALIHLYNKETWHADATQDFTTFPRVLSKHRRGKISGRCHECPNGTSPHYISVWCRLGCWQPNRCIIQTPTQTLKPGLDQSVI